MEIEGTTHIIIKDILTLLSNKKIIDLNQDFNHKNKAQVTKTIKEYIAAFSLYSKETLNTYDIILKIVPINEKRKCHEAISFPFTSLYDITFEEWDTDDEWAESQLKQRLKKTFIFIPVVKNKKAGRFVDWKEWYITDCAVWKPTELELEEIGLEWKKAQQIIKRGVNLVKEPYGNSYRSKNNLLKQSQTNYLHLRPHGRDNFDIDKKYFEYTGGTIEITKQSFWLNKSYINHLLEKKIWTASLRAE